MQTSLLFAKECLGDRPDNKETTSHAIARQHGAHVLRQGDTEFGKLFMGTSGDAAQLTCFLSYLIG
jgi:hypothetical protein